MKQLIAIVLCVLTAPLLFAGGQPLFLANVSGTVYRQVNADGSSKIVSSPLNTKRVFEEFNVSSEDYALVMNVSSDVFLSLIPKDAGSGLPTIRVLEISDSRAIFNGKTGAALFEVPVANTTASGINIFNNLRGTIFGSLKFNVATEAVQRVVGNVTGSSVISPIIKAAEGAEGTPKGALPSNNVLLKFKVTKGGPFVQTGGPV